MKNIILIVLLTALLLAASCKEENINSADHIEAVIDFFVLDESGNDLIAQEIVKEDKITVYYQKEDGMYKDISPKGISISEEVKYGYDKYSMKLFLSLPVNDNTSSTIIDWGIEGFKKDTFDCLYNDQNKSSLFLIEAKLNGEPFYNSSSNIPLEIVKTKE